MVKVSEVAFRRARQKHGQKLGSGLKKSTGSKQKFLSALRTSRRIKKRRLHIRTRSNFL